MSTPSMGGFGRFMSLGGAIEKLRRDNALTESVYDPAEDEPHIIHSPGLAAAEAAGADGNGLQPTRRGWRFWRRQPVR